MKKKAVQLFNKIFLKPVRINANGKEVRGLNLFSILLIIAAIVIGLIFCTKYGVMDDITGIIRAISGA